MTIYGYARVSTDGQSLAAQIAELKAANCAKIFQEKISGARSDRKQLMRLITALAKGDVLVVTRLDRLARSTRDLLNLLGTIAEKGAGFKSLRDAWADTTTAHGRLMLTVLALLWQIYSRCCFSPICFLQYGHRCSRGRTMSSTMAWRMAGRLG